MDGLGLVPNNILEANSRGIVSGGLNGAENRRPAETG